MHGLRPLAVRITSHLDPSGRALCEDEAVPKRGIDRDIQSLTYSADWPELVVNDNDGEVRARFTLTVGRCIPIIGKRVGACSGSGFRTTAGGAGWCDPNHFPNFEGVGFLGLGIVGRLPRSVSAASNMVQIGDWVVATKTIAPGEELVLSVTVPDPVAALAYLARAQEQAPLILRSGPLPRHRPTARQPPRHRHAARLLPVTLEFHVVPAAGTGNSITYWARYPALEVRATRSAGNGLFATETLEPGTVIPVVGQPLTRDEADHLNRVGGGDYLHCLSAPGGQIVDGSPGPGGPVAFRGLSVASMVNEAGPDQIPNCLLVGSWIMVLFRVQPGEELLTYYGDGYARRYAVNDRDGPSMIHILWCWFRHTNQQDFQRCLARAAAVAIPDQE